MMIPKNIWQAHSFECPCGLNHSQPIKDIAIYKGAIEKLGRVKDDLEGSCSKGLIIIDSMLNELIGDSIKAALQKGKVDYAVCLFDTPQVLPNEASIVKIMVDMDETIDTLFQFHEDSEVGEVPDHGIVFGFDRVFLNDIGPWIRDQLFDAE